MYGGMRGGGKSNTLLIIGLLCCCCIILPLIIYGSLWGTNTICDKTNPDDQPWLGMNCASVYEASPAPAPTARTPGPAPMTSPGPARSPASTLISSGTAIQTSEVDLGTASFAPTNKPTVTPGMNPVYSISMWLKTPPMPASSTGLWWTVFGFGGYWNTLVPFTGGKWRLILQTAANSTGPDPNYSNWADIGILDPGRYYHVGFVVSGTLPPQVYVNGQPPSPRATWLYGGGSAQGLYTDGSDAKFNWGNQPMTGTKVKNLYYFNKALTDQEMALLGGSGMGSGTTSGYMIEPFKNWDKIAPY